MKCSVNVINMFIVTLGCFFSLIPFVKQNEFLWVFTRDQFWHSGIVIACICLFVCASALLIHAITHHTFQLKSLNLDWKIQNILVKNHIVLKLLLHIYQFDTSVFQHALHLEKCLINLLFIRMYCRADSRLAPSQWEMPLLSNDISHWLGASLESAL